MTSVSLTVSGFTTLLIGLVAGRCLRGFRGDSEMAHAIAITAGLTAMQPSLWTDVGRVFQPKVASDWLPLFCILAACCAITRPWRYRAAFVILLAVMTPLRMLWGSVYLPSAQWEASVLLSLAGWSAAMALPLLINADRPVNRTARNTSAWGIAVAATSAIITLSGSLTYGAATGICGVSILATLISTSQIPATASMPVLCLIGLSTSFAELPILTAGLLIIVWTGVVLADRISQHRAATFTRFASGAIMALAMSATWTQLSNKTDSSGTAESGYDSSLLQLPDVSSDSRRRISPPRSEGAQKNTAAGTENASDDQGDAADPFGGLLTE